MPSSLFPRLFLACLILIFPVTAVFSAPENSSSQIPPPQPPFVKTPPPGSVWSLVAVYPAEVLASAPAEPSSTTRTAHLEMRLGTNQVSLGTLLDAGGRKAAYYVVKGQILTKTRNTGSVFILSKTRDSDIFDLVASSFPAVNWLSAQNYVGVEKIGPTHYYKFHQLPDPNPIDSSFNGERTAWIRVSDGYPSKVLLDKMVFTFSEVTPFPYPIDLPGEYQATLARQAAKENVLKLLRNSSR